MGTTNPWRGPREEVREEEMWGTLHLWNQAFSWDKKRLGGPGAMTRLRRRLSLEN